jgi:hypothetical protein
MGGANCRKSPETPISSAHFKIGRDSPVTKVNIIDNFQTNRDGDLTSQKHERAGTIVVLKQSKEIATEADAGFSSDRKIVQKKRAFSVSKTTKQLNTRDC